jgi:hypothetical protein
MLDEPNSEKGFWKGRSPTLTIPSSGLGHRHARSTLIMDVGSRKRTSGVPPLFAACRCSITEEMTMSHLGHRHKAARPQANTRSSEGAHRRCHRRSPPSLRSLSSRAADGAENELGFDGAPPMKDFVQPIYTCSC